MKALKKYAPFVAIGAAVLALILYVFLPVLKIPGDEISVWDSMTKEGYKKTPMIVVTVILAIVSVAAAVVAFFKDKIKFLADKADIVNYVVAGVLALTVIFMFSSKGFIVTDYGWKEIASLVDLGIGAILGGILNIVAVAAIVAPKFIKD